ncbi:hypothetical protein SCP_0112310 [Sparassis crispa]|uniref:Uncharacterized protein n=1 Tax=Sparassis crispa TaxID=139825 RepID=A0A401G842_9APHY|nr:hypothetical protein SCP_0112310 [Sparassis crispa]GBE78346.1 hypothetical protein SCP_0112310 [Sparassis crispa]
MERRNLHRDLDKWHRQQAVFMPKVELPDAEDAEDEEDDETFGRPETEALALPSDFNKTERKAFELEVLAAFEKCICIGQVHDLLSAIKESLRH